MENFGEVFGYVSLVILVIAGIWFAIRLKKGPSTPEISPELNRALMKGQEKVLAPYRKRLNTKHQQELQTFAMSGKAVGSSEFFKLTPLVREIVVKMNVVNLEIVGANTKNPFKKAQVWIGKQATIRLSAVDSKKKKRKAEKKKAKLKAKKVQAKADKKAAKNV